MVYTPTNLYCSRHSKLCSSSCVYHWVSYFSLRLSLPLILMEHSISLSQFFWVFVFCVLYTTTRNIFPLNVHTVLIRSIRYLRGLVLFYNPGFFILCHKGFLIIIFVPALENIKDVHVFLL